MKKYITKKCGKKKKTLSFSAQLISQDVFVSRDDAAGLRGCDNHSRLALGDAAQARRCFWMKSCQIVFDALSVGESGPAPSLPSRRSRAVWLWHFTLAQQSRPVTVLRLYSQLLPYTLASVVWPIMNIQLL